MLKVKIKNLLLKSFAVVFATASICALQGTSEAFADVRDPSIWIDGDELKDYGVLEGKTAQALTFGQKQWYIAGQDQNNYILMCSPATGFGSRAFWDDGTQNIYTESSIRHYLTVTKDQLAFPEEEYALSSFTDKEQTLMKKITAADLPGEGDMLVLPSGTFEEESFKVGSGQFETAFSLKEGPYSTRDGFWLRQPGNSEQSALAAAPGYYVTEAPTSDSHAVYPVISLDLSSVYFASAAPAGTAGTSFKPDEALSGRYALTLRYYDNEGRISSVAYRSPDGVYVEKGSESSDVYLYIQSNEGTGWVWSSKIDQSIYFAAGDIIPGLTSLEGCKIWLETVDDNLAFAKDAQIYVPPYSASGNISFYGSVSLAGRALTEYDLFTFTLSEVVNDSETVLATVQNDAAGNIAFPAITYLLDPEHDDTGLHVYKIRQVPFESAEIIPDMTEYTVTVDVNDGPHNGTLAVTPSTEYYGINYSNYAKPSITITANSEEKYYDGTALINSGYMLSGNLMDGDYINYISISGSQTGAGSSYNTPSDAVILNSAGADVTGNYTINYESGMLTVYPANVTVTAYDASKTYGGEEPQLTAFVEGLVNEEPVELISYSVYREPGEDPGTYAIIPQGEAVQGNYSVSYVPGTFTIIQPVRINLHAEGYSGFYDGAAHYVNAYTEIMDGTVITYSTNGTDWSLDVPYILNTGAFTVYVKAENPNCETETAEVTLELAPASATVTAVSASKTYGSEDPELTAAVSGLIGEDVVSYSLERVAGEDAGTYTITASGDAFQGNYSVIYENAEFIISPASAAVTANDAFKYYGDADPQLSAVVTGLVNGDTEEKISYSIGREVGDDPGTYAIIPQGETAQGNYTVSYVPGIFTIIEQQKIELSVTGYSGTYDGTAHYVSASTVITEGTVITYSTNGTDWSGDVPYITNVGAFTVYVKAENPNCRTETAEAVLEIIPAPATVTANDASKYYGDADPQLSAVVTGLVNGDTEEKISYSIGREAGDDPGTYAIIPQGEAAQGNYTVSYVPGIFTIIEQPKIELSVTGYSGTYDSTAHYVSASTVITEGTVITYSTNGTDWSGDVPYITDVGSFTVYVKAENPNCRTETAEAVLELTPATATVLAVSTGKTYGGVDPELTANVGGLIGEDTVTYSLERAPGEDAGAYAIIASGEAVQGNYNVIYENAEFVIDPAQAKVTAIDNSKTYGSTDPDLTASITGLVNGDGEDKITYNIARETGEDPGTYAIIPQGETAQGNYTVSYVPGTFTITEQQKIELSVTGYSGTYDSTAHYVSASTVITEGTVITYSTNGTDWSGDIPYITDVGSFTVYVKAENPNCQTENAEVTLEITPAAATVTADNSAKTYGTADPSLTAKITGLVNGETEDKITYNISRAEGEDAGTYTISVSGNAAQGNYAVTFVNAEFMITPAPATVTADNTGKVLHAEDPTLTATVTGLVNGDTADKIKYTISRETGEEVGTYAITPQGETAQGNYTVSYASGTFTITEQPKIDLSVTGYSGTYDGTAHYVSASSVITEGTVITYSTNGTDWSGDVPYVTDVGKITVYVKAENPNCQTENAETILEITPAAATVNAENAAKTYGAAEPSLTAKVDGLVNDESEDKIAYSITRAEGEDAGTYTISVSGNAAQGNYTVTFVNAEFMITPAPATVTADNAGKVLHAEDPTLTAKVTGLVNGDTADKIKYTISRETGEEVGTYAITPQGETAQGNYTVSYVSGTFTITEQPKIELSVTGYSGTYDGTAHYVSASTVITEGTVITYSTNGTDWSSDKPYVTDVDKITVYVKAENPNCQTETAEAVLELTPAAATVTAANAAKTYGTADPALTATISGLVNKETEDKITYNVARAEGEDAGTYTISVSGEALQGNYSVTYKNAEFIINPAPATVTAINAAKTYGTADPALTATVTGLVNNETADKIVYTVARAEGEDVGTYVITPSGEAAQGNYSVTYKNADFMITPAPATVTAKDASKVYGAKDPTFTATITGLVNNDTEDKITYTISREAGEGVGTYAITPQGETAQGNYTVSYVNGKFTITSQATFDLSVTGYSGTYDGTMHYVSASATITDGTVITYSTNGIDWSANVPYIIDVGKITVYVKAANPNFETKTAETVLEIAPAPVTVKANDASKTVGAAEPVLTASVTGLVNNETADKIVYNISRSAGENPGTYSIVVFGNASQGNYTVSYVSGTFTIKDKIVYTTGDTGNIEWTKGDLSGLTVTIKGSSDDNTTFSKFRGAQVDKITVQAKDMQISSGSLILTLKASYLSLISAGEHTLDIFFSDGSISVPFTIKDAATPTPTLTPTGTPTPSVSPTITPTKTVSPTVTPSATPGTDNGGDGTTGDNHHRMIWIMLIIAAAAVIAIVLIWRRKDTKS